jgi:ribosome-associated toxin RatA of RatAB toxin-antitoxin module
LPSWLIGPDALTAAHTADHLARTRGYRAVDLLWRQDNAVVARMCAERSRFPVSWTCFQQRFSDEPRITFRHIAGFTNGMEVVWYFTPLENQRVRVEIVHDFHKGWPILDGLVSDRVVGGFFVSNIAAKTLARIKALAEAGHQLDLGSATRMPPADRTTLSQGS